MWFLIIIAVLTLAFWVYSSFTSKYKLFEERGVPFIKPKFPAGNLPSIISRKRNIFYDIDDIYQEFRGKEPLVGYFEMRTPKFLAISPETVKSVLVKNFKNFHDNEFSKMIDKEKDPIFSRNPFMLRGEVWKEKRAEITPAFTPNRIKALFPLVDEVLGRLTKYVRDEIKKESKEPFDAREICAKFTSDVVSSCIFNADAQSFTKENPEIRTMGGKFFQFGPFQTFIMVLYTLIPSLFKVYTPKMVLKEVEDFFTNLMYQAIEIREKNNIQRDDYLAYLISMKNKKQLTELDMAAHGVTFFLDGFETSSLAIAHTLYELGNNKTVQNKLREEIEDIFDSDGKLIYDKLVEHEYLDQVFHEGLRLHPPAVIIFRECTEAVELEGVKGKKHLMNVGENITIPILSIHLDPEYYPDPNAFNPDRFDAEHGGIKAFKDKGILLPFGDGPRICLGMRFALMQSKAAIAEIIRNFEVSVDVKTQRPLIIEPNDFLNVKVGKIWLKFEALK